MKSSIPHAWNLATRSALAFAPLLVAACGDAPITRATDTALLASADRLVNQPLELEYVKVETGAQTGMWTGRIWGDLLPSGVGLETEVYGLRVTGSIWHIETSWTVDGGTRAFRAELAGTVDTGTGDLVLNGTIVSGIFAGAQVHNEGRLTQVLGSGATVFEGRLRIMPASAG